MVFEVPHCTGACTPVRQIDCNTVDTCRALCWVGYLGNFRRNEYTFVILRLLSQIPKSDRSDFSLSFKYVSFGYHSKERLNSYY